MMRYETFSVAGQRAPEMVLCAGQDDAVPAPDAPLVVIVPPLFEESNRLRRTVVAVMRRLAEAGIASALPDLPGQNESAAAMVDATLDGWRAALRDFVAAQRGRPVIILSLRGGALIDDQAAAAHWMRFAPANGSSLLKGMLRTRVAGDREAGVASTIDGLMAQARVAPLLLQGNLLSPAMLAALDGAVPRDVVPTTLLRLGTEVTGAPLWLRAEPGEDAAMTASLTDAVIACVRELPA